MKEYRVTLIVRRYDERLRVSEYKAKLDFALRERHGLCIAKLLPFRFSEWHGDIVKIENVEEVGDDE